MLWKISLVASKLAVLAALISTVPSTIYHYGKSEGLAVSFILVLFYFLKGFAQMFLGIKSPKMKDVNRFLHLLELPVVLLLVYTSLFIVPAWMTKPYEWFLLLSNPLFIIMEGAACMLIIQYFGQMLLYYDPDQPKVIRSFLVAFCLFCYCLSAAIFYNVYLMPEISIFSASLCSGAITLCMVLTAMTINSDQGILSDSACLTTYVAYNVWMLSQEWTKQKDPNRSRFLSGYSFSNGSMLSSVNFSSGLRSILHLCSVEIAASLIFRVSAFVISSKIIEKLRKSSDVDIDEEDAISFSELLNCFGKCIVIMVYTHSWIDQYEPNGAIDYAFWRWINIFVSMSLFLWNLKTPLDPELVEKTFESTN